MLSKTQFRVVAVFAAGYFVSYLFRGINIGFAPFLTQQLGLSAADLGTLTSVYFLGFACAQVPAGVLLDHFGARRVTAGLMMITAVGALVFGMAGGLHTMLVGRLLIGVGVSACLGGAFKAIAQTFPIERLPMINGIVMAVGGLGGVAVGSPLAWLLTLVDWRMVCLMLAALTTLASLAIWFGAAEPAQARSQTSQTRIVDQLKGTCRVLGSALFWKFALFSSVSQGVFYGMQSLWAGAFLRDVGTAGIPMSAAAAATMISILGIAFMSGNVVFGALARMFLKMGLTVNAFCNAGMVLFVVVQLLIVAQVPLPPLLLWAAYGALGCIGILTYAVLAEHFPAHMTGRVNTTFTLVIFALIFLVQIAVGLMLNHWPMTDGHYPAAAHLFAWKVLIAVQVASAIWGFLPLRRSKPAAAEPH
jgi:predicted MFS family arabinose efflux permease